MVESYSSEDIAKICFQNIIRELDPMMEEIYKLQSTPDDNKLIVEREIKLFLSNIEVEEEKKSRQKEEIEEVADKELKKSSKEEVEKPSDEEEEKLSYEEVMNKELCAEELEKTELFEMNARKYSNIIRKIFNSNLQQMNLVKRKFLETGCEKVPDIFGGLIKFFLFFLKLYLMKR